MWKFNKLMLCSLVALIAGAVLSYRPAVAQDMFPLDMFTFTRPPSPIAPVPQALDQQLGETENVRLAAHLQKQIVDYPGREEAETIIIDTPNTFLYYVLGNGKAVRYGIGVGREGFTWSGVKSIDRKTEWPDWYPPHEMIKRQPYLPRMVAGGPGNPLGARAMYISGTEYRIHGTNDPTTIGKFVSSGCIRLTNENVVDLYNRVKLGAKVIVLPMDKRHALRAPRVS